MEESLGSFSGKLQDFHSDTLACCSVSFLLQYCIGGGYHAVVVYSLECLTLELTASILGLQRLVVRHSLWKHAEGGCFWQHRGLCSRLPVWERVSRYKPCARVCVCECILEGGKEMIVKKRNRRGGGGWGRDLRIYKKNLESKHSGWDEKRPNIQAIVRMQVFDRFTVGSLLGHVSCRKRVFTMGSPLATVNLRHTMQQSPSSLNWEPTGRHWRMLDARCAKTSAGSGGGCG